MHERRTKGKYFRMWSMHMISIGTVVSSLTSSPKGAHTLRANCSCDFLHMP